MQGEKPGSVHDTSAMTARVIQADGSVQDADTITLPRIFATPFRPDLIHKAFVNLSSHSFQPQGRHPTAGMDVVADTNDPPTGRGISRVARATGGGGSRRGQGAEVASTRGGRQAHPPKAEKQTYKRLNKKEGRLAFCSAVAATASRSIVESRGHDVYEYASRSSGGTFPIVVDDGISKYGTAREVTGLLERLGLIDDVRRLDGRKARSGRPSLRGRSKKRGKSVLFVTHDDDNDAQSLKRAVGSLPGVDARSVSELSVLDLAPGADPIRLAVFTRSAVEQLGGIRSTHLQTMIEPDRIGYREDSDSDDGNGADSAADPGSDEGGNGAADNDSSAGQGDSGNDYNSSSNSSGDGDSTGGEHER